MVDRVTTEDSVDPTTQYVESAVLRTKFDAEVAAFRALASDHMARGWWLLEAEFPGVFVVFAAPQLRPPAVVLGVQVDFTNYDLDAPSVVLVDPFTRQPYRAKELPTNLPRRQPLELPFGGAAMPVQMIQAVPLMQALDGDEVPFLCVPGVREYHRHPAHTGDSWLNHRGTGEGTLFHILNIIYQYGVQPIREYGLALRVSGFRQGEPPA